MHVRIAYRMAPQKQLSEDFYFFHLDSEKKRVIAAVGDWASTPVGGPYHDDETAHLLGRDPSELFNGGVIGSTLAKNVVAHSDLTGFPLFAAINERLRRKYTELGIQDVEHHRERSFAGYVAHLLATPSGMDVTVIGDVRVAADGQIVAGTTKNIDLFYADLRAMWIRRFGTSSHLQTWLRERLIEQYHYQNAAGDHPLNYPALDGTAIVPESGITYVHLPLPQRCTLWSDGYESPVDHNYTLEGLERYLHEVFTTDPQRCEQYPAVKATRDDKTAMEILFDSWDSLHEEHIYYPH